MAYVRLGAALFVLVQLRLVPPAYPTVILGVVAMLAASGLGVLTLYSRRPAMLAEDPVRAGVFAVDCLAFALALAVYARPTDLTWVTFILVLLSATIRWDVRGAIAAVSVFAIADLPLDVLTPAYTHLVFDPGSITFKLGLITLLAVFFALHFRTTRDASTEQERQAAVLRAQAEAVLTSEGHMRAIFDTALMAMVSIDENGVVRDWNRRAEELFGWLKGEVIGRRLTETIIPPRHRAAHEAGLARYRATREGQVLGRVMELTALHRAGREFPIELSISRAANLDGKATFIAFMRDITERKHAEALQAVQLGLTRALADAGSIQEAAPRVLDELGRGYDLALAQWWELDRARKVLRWRESWFAGGISSVDFISDSQGMVFARGEGLPGQVWERGGTVLVQDLEHVDGGRRDGAAAGAGLRSAVAVPILNGLEVTGVLELYSTGPLPGDEAVRSLASVGSQVGQFVERRRAEGALHAAGERITAVLENIADGIITMDERGRIQSLNAAARRMFAYLPEEVMGSSVDSLVPKEERDHFLQRLLATSSGWAGSQESALALETVGRRMDGSTFPLEMRPSEMSLAGQKVFIVSLRDISERKAQTEALQYQALHDALTGLPNRTLLGDRLRQAIAAAARERRPLALLLLDLDRFKEVNDTMGHPHGDLILQQVASRVRDLLREADTVARLGGDEFAVLPSGATAREGAVRTAQKIIKALEKPFVIEDRAFDIRASIGIALYPQHGEDAETLMRRADLAMYVAKRGKRPHELYQASHDQDTALRLALMSELRHAADREELVLHYQPKLDLRIDRVVAVEALVRWEHPERGTLSPDQFMGYAEQTEIINSITRWVVDAALSQLREWLDAGLDLSIAVNMSARNLHDPELPQVVDRLLGLREVPPERLIVEITEGIAMDGAAEERLQQLAALGVRMSIDDFGTGYSSLAYLKRLPVDELKIDRSFVIHMDGNPDDAAIVRPTIDLGHNLGLRVTAEGVETAASLEMLKTYGCDLVQGHHICSPCNADELTRWLLGAAAGRHPRATMA